MSRVTIGCHPPDCATCGARMQVITVKGKAAFRCPWSKAATGACDWPMPDRGVAQSEQVW